MKQQYLNYTDKDIETGAKEVKSLAGLLKYLGLRVAGGNYANMKRKLQALQIDTSHWTGQGWTKNKQLKNWSCYTKSVSLKKVLIKERGHQCECCHRKMWLSNPIPIELDHIDGDRTNNGKENLKLLCPNCHALTPTWRGRNK